LPHHPYLAIGAQVGALPELLLPTKSNRFLLGGLIFICDDFDDYHNEVAVAGVDFINRQSICGDYLQEKGCS
jgi:hypothetical protein